MYFRDRAEAGRKLVAKLEKYKAKHIVVVALGEGSSIVAAQVAMHLHANLFLYLIRDIDLPGEDFALAGMGSGDVFSYNRYFTTSEIEEFAGEYRSYIEQKRMDRSHELHAILGNKGEIDKSFLRHRTVLLIADGLGSGYSLDVAQEFFKSIAIKSLVIATPVASVNAVDRMHLVGDEIYCLSVIENFMGTDHYYDDNSIPTVPSILKMMQNIAMTWDHEAEKPGTEPKLTKKAAAAEKPVVAEKPKPAPKPKKQDDGLIPIPLEDAGEGTGLSHDADDLAFGQVPVRPITPDDTVEIRLH